MKNIILFLAYLISNTCCAQVDPKIYYIFSESSKQVVFHDEFDNNKNGWMEENEPPCTDSYAYKIENGILYFHDNREGFHELSVDLDIDYSRNFEITFKLKVNGAKKDELYAHVHWGRDSATLFGVEYGQMLYLHNYSGYGQMGYAYTRDEHEAKNIYLPTTFYRGGFNVYTVRKYNNWYYLFINAERIMRFKYLPLKVKKIALGGNTNAIVEYDYIKIAYLPD